MAIHPAVKILLDEIDAFRARAGLSASAFGTEALNDPTFVGDLIRGRSPGFATVDRVRAFMREREGAVA